MASLSTAFHWHCLHLHCPQDNAIWWHLKDYPFILDWVSHINRLKSHKKKRKILSHLKNDQMFLVSFFSSWIRNVSESSPNNVYCVAYSPPSTASVSDVLQILFLEDGLLAFYSAKTQDVLLSVGSLIDDLMLWIFIKERKVKWFPKTALWTRNCFLKYLPYVIFKLLQTKCVKLNNLHWINNS